MDVHYYVCKLKAIVEFAKMRDSADLWKQHYNYVHVQT